MSVIIEINKQTKFKKFHHFDTILQEISIKALDISGLHKKNQNISLLLCDDAKIQELNKNFRGYDKPTNVLSFSNGEIFDGIKYLGDIAISIPRIIVEAEEQSKTFKTHFCHMFTHGVLHLLGFDHQIKNEKTIMENAEDAILKYISES